MDIRKRLEQELRTAAGRLRHMGGTAALEELLGPTGEHWSYADEVDEIQANERREIGFATRELLVERFLGPDDYSLVVIPPGIWTGFKGMDEVSIVANCATHPHDPERTERADPFGDRVPYEWAVRHR